MSKHHNVGVRAEVWWCGCGCALLFACNFRSPSSVFMRVLVIFFKWLVASPVKASISVLQAQAFGIVSCLWDAYRWFMVDAKYWITLAALLNRCSC